MVLGRQDGFSHWFVHGIEEPEPHELWGVAVK